MNLLDFLSPTHITTLTPFRVLFVHSLNYLISTFFKLRYNFLYITYIIVVSRIHSAKRNAGRLFKFIFVFIYNIIYITLTRHSLIVTFGNSAALASSSSFITGRRRRGEGASTPETPRVIELVREKTTF